jgi:multiple sugar transport system substrate-binding protein
MDRRRFLKALGAGAGVLASVPLLQACSSSVPPAAKPAEAPKAAPPVAAPAATSAPNQAVGTAVVAKPAATAAAKPAMAAPPPGQLMPIAADSTPNPNVKGNLIRWRSTFDNPDLEEAKYNTQFLEYMGKKYPNLKVQEEQVSYADMLDKMRVAVRGGSPPHIARSTILWAPELAAQGYVREMDLADYGFKKEDFFPAALKSVTWKDKIYGIPSNNETMAMIINTQIFKEAGITKDLETWEDVATFSKQIKDKTGKIGFGLVGRLNHGNTPYRIMPTIWGYGGGVFDEADENPKYEEIRLGNKETVDALKWAHKIYVEDKSTSQAAITNTATEYLDLFIAGQVGMMINHPSAYPAINQKAPDVAAQTEYVLMPKGPARRAVAFGGWSLHIFNKIPDDMVEPAKIAVKEEMQPEWATKLVWNGSNPGIRSAYEMDWQKIRFEQIKFLNVTTEMLQYGIAWPAVPQAGEIMNVIVPEMLQNVLTEKTTPEKAATDAADKVKKIMATR